MLSSVHLSDSMPKLPSFVFSCWADRDPIPHPNLSPNQQHYTTLNPRRVCHHKVCYYAFSVAFYEEKNNVLWLSCWTMRLKSTRLIKHYFCNYVIWIHYKIPIVVLRIFFSIANLSQGHRYLLFTVISLNFTCPVQAIP